MGDCLHYEAFLRNRITELCEKNKISEHYLSLALGKSGSYIRSITNGNALPSVRELFNIILYFELTPSEFFSGLGNNSFSRAELYKKLGDLSDEDIEKVSLFVSWIQK